MLVIKITEFTDPYCTWCWGSEPILRKLKEVYGEQISIEYKMGGLVKDIKDFYDPLNYIGGELWYEQVAIHWEEASRKHGMPVDSSVFYEIKDSFTSTYPANIAVKAAELQDKDLAKKYLRRLREGAAAERKHIHKIEVQVELAKEIGLDPIKFREDIVSGIAEYEFYKDLKECRSLGITGFPTFLIENLISGEKILVEGYHRYDYFEGLIDKLAGKPLSKRIISKNDVLGFIKRWEKVATQEVATLLNINKTEALKLLSTLEGKVIKRKAGNDYFWFPSEG